MFAAATVAMWGVHRAASSPCSFHSLECLPTRGIAGHCCGFIFNAFCKDYTSHTLVHSSLQTFPFLQILTDTCCLYHLDNGHSHEHIPPHHCVCLHIISNNLNTISSLGVFNYLLARLPASCCSFVGMPTLNSNPWLICITFLPVLGFFSSGCWVFPLLWEAL